MNKQVIAIDIDDVLSSSATAFIEWSNVRFGTSLTHEDYHEHWAEMWKISLEEARKRSDEFHKSDVVSKHKLIDGAKEALEKLKNKFTLVLITSRRMSLEKMTIDWIRTHYQDTFNDCIFAGFYDSRDIGGLKMTKANIAKNIKADYLIDDQLKHIEAAAEVGIQGLLFGNYKWNQKDLLHENIVRVKDWKAVIKYFDL
ncbi:hypothetical protein H0W91_04310 [Patescibacteria group bacterium]|nr:hypothetical protein [Patescibacteria group bacterium]